MLLTIASTSNLVADGTPISEVKSSNTPPSSVAINAADSSIKSLKLKSLRFEKSLVKYFRCFSKGLVWCWLAPLELQW